MLRLPAAIAVCVLFLPVISSGQSTPTLKANTEVVLIPALVRDAGGRVVTGLSKEDFEVFEDGKAQALAIFEETTTTASLAPERTSDGEFSNALQEQPGQTRMTIIVLDMLNTTFQDQAYARAQLLKYLSKSVDAREPTALFALGRKGLVGLHDFTQDPRGLVVALKVVGGETQQQPKVTRGADIGSSIELLSAVALSLGSNPNTSVNDPAVKAAAETAERLVIFRNGAEGEYNVLQGRITVSQTLAALDQLAHAYAAVPGRKSLIWTTGGFPFDISPSGGLSLPTTVSAGEAWRAPEIDNQSSGRLPSLPESRSLLQSNDMAQLLPMYERTVQLLTHANIAVYPIDARGLVAFNTESSRSTDNAGLNSDLRGEQFTSQVSMEGIASATGGKAFYNRNDLGLGFRQASEDGNTYYNLGFYRKGKASPGWHKIEVKSKRPGLQIRARRGYLVPKQAMDSKTTRLVDVAMAMTAPVNFSGMPFFVKWKGQSPDKKGKKKIDFEMWIPPDRRAADDTMNLEILAAVQDEKGQIVDQMGEILGKNLKPEEIVQVRQKGLAYKNQLLAPTGEYKVKFIIRDNVNGRLGSLQVPLKVE